MLGNQTFRIGFGVVFTGVSVHTTMPSLRDFIAKGTVVSFSSILPFGFAALFVLVGCSIVAGAIWRVLSVWRTAYAVTNRRVLIVNNFIRRNVLAVAPDGLNALDWNEGGDGSGSVTFRRETVNDGEGTSVTKLAFVGVRDVRNAVRELEKLRQAARAA
jgi:hypothetical protein